MTGDAPRPVRAGHRRRNRPGLPDAAAAQIRDRAGEVAAAAQGEQLTCAGFLAELLLAECDDRDRRRSARRRLKAAGFPREKWLTDFDYAANPNIAPAVIANLATCAWIAKGEPLCLIGDSGTGKNHLLIAWAPTPPNRATGSSTCSPPSWPTSCWRPPTTDSCRKPLPATAELIFCAWTSSATWSWTGVGPSCCSKREREERERERERERDQFGGDRQ